MAAQYDEVNPPPRVLMGPGPSLVHARVLRAMSAPLLGHLDPAFLAIMNDIQRLLRFVFQSNHHFTIAVAGTGSAGMEAALVNVVEPGDPVIVAVNGVFGSRMAAIVERCGGQCLRVEVPWGRIIEPEAVETALKRSGAVKAIAIVHAETSTGVRQPLEEIGALCRRYGALFIVDAVTSLGGLPVKVDAWGIDICYSATQKCLSCPPGLSPLTVSEQAMAAVRRRKKPCQSWYFDFSLIADYWVDSKRAYHHTAPISMLYALREALRLVQEEGLEARYDRHRLNSRALSAGLQALGFSSFPQAGYELPSLICVTLPPSIDEAKVRTALLRDYGVEIGGGLGLLQGKVWRIGLMGESSSRANVLSLLSALEHICPAPQRIEQAGVALAAAAQVYAQR
ncbi:MAG: alanine--glyoxylate aminotransferase family protein [Nitrospiraceae bacterium]|nr:alanine--glyoxylate aminotransferase family protein [Nitrospiraceae bacterium]